MTSPGVILCTAVPPASLFQCFAAINNPATPLAVVPRLKRVRCGHEEPLLALALALTLRLAPANVNVSCGVRSGLFVRHARQLERRRCVLRLALGPLLAVLAQLDGLLFRLQSTPALFSSPQRAAALRKMLARRVSGHV